MKAAQGRARESVAEGISVSRPETGRKSLCLAAFLLFAGALFGTGVARAQQSSDAPAAGNAQNGKKLFMAVGCYECHGRMGQGAAQTGAARIGPPILSFDGFQQYVRGR